MGNVIKFPVRRASSKVQKTRESTSVNPDRIGPSVISDEEDEAFLELIKEWPCFIDDIHDCNLHQLFELYYDDKLTLSQDCVLEFMFHMHDPDSSFDIGNALYTWDEEDRNFFILSINMHAELIDRIKKNET